jgi:hypothetical protein
MVVIVLILLLAWYGFFGGHWFGSGGGSGINVTVHTTP